MSLLYSFLSFVLVHGFVISAIFTHSIPKYMGIFMVFPILYAYKTTHEIVYKRAFVTSFSILSGFCPISAYHLCPPNNINTGSL